MNRINKYHNSGIAPAPWLLQHCNTIYIILILVKYYCARNLTNTIFQHPNIILISLSYHIVLSLYHYSARTLTITILQHPKYHIDIIIILLCTLTAVLFPPLLSTEDNANLDIFISKQYTNLLTRYTVFFPPVPKSPPGHPRISPNYRFGTIWYFYRVFIRDSSRCSRKLIMVEGRFSKWF